MAGIMRSRFLTNDANELERELVDAYVTAHRDLLAQRADGIVQRRSPKSEGRVGLVIANGVGHEPAMLGLVGPGLFDVNVPGRLFAAPGPGRIADGIEAARRGGGVLLCVSNHRGDVMNAELALERVADRGFDLVEMVVCYDDVATGSADDPTERRGTAGLLFVWKTVGAAAEQDADLKACVEIAERTRDATRTLGVTLAGTRHPVTGAALGDVPDGHVVVGAGVHGEPGADTIAFPTADDLVDVLLDRILDELGDVAGQGVLLAVNDAGGTAPLELALVRRAALRRLDAEGATVRRSWAGRYATTLDTAGFALSVCVVDDDLAALYDAPCRSGAFVSTGEGLVG